MSGEKGKEKSHFSTIVLSQLPDGRRSKHTQIVNRILDELWKLDGGNALRVARESFGQEKLSNVRAAVSRAVKKHGLDVATATDEGYFYIWFNSRVPTKADGDGAKPQRPKIDGDGRRSYRAQAEASETFRPEGAGKRFLPPEENPGRTRKR